MFFSILRTAAAAFTLMTPLFGQNVTALRLYGMEYPRLAAQAGVHGVVTVLCELRADGTVLRTKSVKGPAVLADAAIENAAKWKFTEPSASGESSVTIVYNFEFRNAEKEQTANDFVFEYPNKVWVSSVRPVIAPDRRRE